MKHIMTIGWVQLKCELLTLVIRECEFSITRKPTRVITMDKMIYIRLNRVHFSFTSTSN